jgi:hypothetical protein
LSDTCRVVRDGIGIRSSCYKQEVSEMGGENAAQVKHPRLIGRSIMALAAGFVVNVFLSFATDFALSAIGILPSIGDGAMNDTQSLLAAAYRTVYGVISSYVVARLAPYAPLGHALTGAAIGMVLATAGAMATWNQGLGPHWYSLSLVVTALPAAWVGGKLGAKRWVETKRA